MDNELVVRKVQTGDITLVKQLNKVAVLNLVRRSSPISRANLAEATGLNKSTIWALTSELVAENQILEVGAGHSGGGRRPQLLSFNARFGLALGIRIGVNASRAILCDLLGQPVRTEDVQIDPGEGVQATVSKVVQLARRLIQEAPETPRGIIGVCVGVPGRVDAASGTLLYSPVLGWRDVRLASLLEGELGLPVHLEAEANAGALGEKWFGSGAQARNLVFVSVGMGIGVGLIVNGEIYRGTHGVAGEFGHMTIESSGAMCTCGNRGCWEAMASERALRRRLPGRDHTSLQDLLVAAEGGDAEVIAALHEVGKYFGIGLANVINGFDPDMVIVGGPLSRAGKWLLNPAEQSLQTRVTQAPARGIPVTVSSLGLDATVLGGVSLLLEQYFGSRPR